jgi:hypothetical protein
MEAVATLPHMGAFTSVATAPLIREAGTSAPSAGIATAFTGSCPPMTFTFKPALVSALSDDELALATVMLIQQHHAQRRRAAERMAHAMKNLIGGVFYETPIDEAVWSGTVLAFHVLEIMRRIGLDPAAMEEEREIEFGRQRLVIEVRSHVPTAFLP